MGERRGDGMKGKGEGGKEGRMGEREGEPKLATLPKCQSLVLSLGDREKRERQRRGRDREIESLRGYNWMPLIGLGLAVIG